MPINTAIWANHLRHAIADLPVNLKFNNRTYPVSLEATTFALALLEGGLPENFTGRVTMVKSDIVGRLPHDRDICQLQVNNGKWMQVEVKDTPDIIDAQSVSHTILIGNPET